MNSGRQVAVKALLCHRHITERGSEIHVPLRLGQPLEEGHAGFFALRCGFHGTDSRSALHDQLFSALKDRTGQRNDLDLFGAVVLIGHYVGIVQHTGRRGNGCDHIAGAQRFGGVAAAQPQSAGQRGSGVRLPRAGKRRTEGDAVLVKKALSQRFHAHLKVVEVVIVDEKALAARPFRISLRHRVQSLPGGQLVQSCAGFGGKTVESRLVHKEDLRGFCQRQNDQTIIDCPFLNKFRKVGIQLFVCEIVVIIRQNVLIRQGQHGLGVGHEQIGQSGRAGVLVGGRQHVFMDHAAVADAVHPHPNALLLPDSTVKLIHQRIHGRVYLAAVNVPEGNGDRFSVVFPAGGEAQHKTGSQRRQHKNSFFHGYASFLFFPCKSKVGYDTMEL